MEDEEEKMVGKGSKGGGLKTLLEKTSSSTSMGGLKTMPFIIVNESFERLASTGLLPNMIFYLMRFYHMDAAFGSSVLAIWSALSNGLAIVGAVASDSYLGRFRVIALGSFSALLGMTLLWLTAMFPQLRPLPCEDNCDSPTPAQLAILFSAFGLISIGAGCIRPCSIAFGADQITSKENPNNERILDTFFNWYYASTGIATVFALTSIVYIQDHFGWQVGFAVPALLMVLSTLMLLLGSSLYIKVKPGESLFTGFIQVFVVAFKNRNTSLPHSHYDYCYLKGNGTELTAPTDNLRCLNKACIIRDFEEDLNPNGTSSKPWSLCTIEQVESLKALLRIIPMWSAGIIIFVSLGQSFPTLQAKTMNRHITRNFEFPAASFNLFLVITLTIWVAFYDRVVVPLLAKFTGMPRGLNPKLRMIIGSMLSCLAMAVSAVVETIRREKAINEGLYDDPTGLVDMSAMWLVPQFALLGLAEGLNSIGQIEFFYSQFPKTMSSIAVAMITLELALSGLINGFLIQIVDGLSSYGGSISWLSSNINKGHVDYFYWLLTSLNLLNLVYLIICCRMYGRSEERIRSRNQALEEESCSPFLS